MHDFCKYRQHFFYSTIDSLDVYSAVKHVYRSHRTSWNQLRTLQLCLSGSPDQWSQVCSWSSKSWGSSGFYLSEPQYVSRGRPVCLHHGMLLLSTDDKVGQENPADTNKYPECSENVNHRQSRAFLFISYLEHVIYLLFITEICRKTYKDLISCKKQVLQHLDFY